MSQQQQRVYMRWWRWVDLDDANLVGDVEGVVVGGQAHVGLLEAIGSAQAGMAGRVR